MIVKVPVSWLTFHHKPIRAPNGYFVVNASQLGCKGPTEIYRTGYSPSMTKPTFVDVDDSFEISRFLVVINTLTAKYGPRVGEAIDFYSLYAKMPLAKAIYLKLIR